MSTKDTKKQIGRTPNEKMHEDLPLGSSPPRPSNNKVAFHTTEVDICDGEVKLLRTKASADIWQMRVWIRKEGKYFRQSLREKNLEKAKEKAKSIFYKMMGQVEIGARIFSISIKEIIEQYLKHQFIRVDNGFITKGRATTIQTQLKHLVDFVGENTRLDAINRNKYRDYYAYRKKKKPEVTNVTLINERATIGNLYKWSMEQGYINQSQLPLWSEIRRNVSYRKAFQRDEYRVLYSYIRKWHNDVSNPKDIYERKLVRDFILILANTGMRFGEARFIKWNYVDIIKNTKSQYPNVHIRIPKEISKVNKDRTSIGMRGDIFNRIKTYSTNNHQQDYVFANHETGEAINRKTLYRLWEIIRKESGIAEFPELYSYYSLRHTYATYRLQFGNVDVFTLSKVMGCSVKYIEEHYGQIQTDKMTDYITRNKNVMDSNVDEIDRLFVE
jgi:integrase|tara:strand:+ start:121 stop:1449 length:1329 start_codon:yes stop_codon:yes gene_type:complete